LASEIKFGTDGWRAVMCDAFTFANVRLVIQAIADHVIENDMRDRGVLVGYDARFLSPGFADVAAEVLAANGIPTLITDRDTPTPVVAFTVADRQPCRSGHVYRKPQSSRIQWREVDSALRGGLLILKSPGISRGTSPAGRRQNQRRARCPSPRR